MHDFKKNPELLTSQFTEEYFNSPHRQITEDFVGKVEKVTDGDTIRVSTNFRDFLTTIRLANIAAPEMSEGGEEAKNKLEEMIGGETVHIIVDPQNRVGKFGRIIGEIMFGGFNINEEMMRTNFAVDFGIRKMGVLQDFDKSLMEFSI